MAWLFLLVAGQVSAQKFFNLTASEVSVDSLLPQFVYSQALGDAYQDSVYTVTLKYPEYIDLTLADIANYNKLSGAIPPSEVSVAPHIATTRKKGYLMVSFSPIVFRDNKYQALVSFMLDIKSAPLKRSALKARAAMREAASATYASHSVLATGRWAKIRVGDTGIYQLTEDVIRQAGFTDINKVKIYGYGGNLLNEKLVASELLENDDLKEVPQCVVNGKHLFWGKGPVNWSSSTVARRTRNPYSDYGYYFITQSDDAPTTMDADAFATVYSRTLDAYHSLYEVDGYSWYNGGRNLFDPTPIAEGQSKDIMFSNETGQAGGRLYVNVSAGVTTSVQVLKNGTVLGSLNIKRSDPEYEMGAETLGTYTIKDFKVDGTDTITVKTLLGGPARIDYVSVAWNQPKTFPDLSGNFASTAYVCNITNQDLHADKAIDMVIIIPTSQKLLKQAQRLQAYHESHDGLRVRIVPADELYNEFSSGTPDAGAYRKYLKMLYDRAETEADMPKYLLLFGDCVWDNRMLTSACKALNPDDYLLCYESENSYSKIYCYVSDSWLGILSDGSGLHPTYELQDVGVGRFPVTTAEQAKILVDKSIGYMDNANAGAWQNTLMFMGDDGNNNKHMDDANTVCDYVSGLYPGFLMKKVMWDAYTRVSTSTGNTYPEAAKVIKQQQRSGALIMDYAGHGMDTQISHEGVLKIADFAEFTNKNLPLWITASCDIMPFDGVSSTIGETAILNEKGGAVAFYGTTRTVFAEQNKYINRAFVTHVLSTKDGKPVTLGEAHRLAQNTVMLGNVIGYNEKGQPIKETDQSQNHLQYSLLGDPALSLNLPTSTVVVDSINGVALDKAPENSIYMKAGSVARISGHVEGHPDLNGVVAATVRDSKELITCKLNDPSKETGASKAFQYYDRQRTFYNGSDSVRGGKFDFSFAVPKDINYSNESGLINLYAISSDRSVQAHGACEDFLVGGSEEMKNDSIGPSIYCYLNSPSFVNGGNVNTTPFFVAQVNDKDGINAAGSGIGHDLQLVVDGDMMKTYVLNDNFSYDFGTYTSGSTYYSIPELSEGPHQLQFRAWDIQNNCSTATLSFNVVRGLSPTLFDVGVTNNPARTSTTFIISHDRMESDMDVVIDIFDTAGRQLWRHSEKGVPATSTYTVDWDLSVDGGRPLGTGVYLYRVNIATDGSSYSSKTKKLIIVR